MTLTTFLLVVAPSDIIDAGQKVGTASNQVILGILLVVMILCLIGLGGVIAWLHRANQRTISTFIEKMEAKENAMTKERTDRIASLLHLIERDIAVQEQVKHAIENNTQAIRELKEFIKDFGGKPHK